MSRRKKKRVRPVTPAELERKKKYYAKVAASGLCWGCKETPAKAKKRYCYGCLKAKALKQSERRKNAHRRQKRKRR